MAVVGVSSLASDVVELHHSIEDAGVMRMVEQESFSVPAGGRLDLAPGGYHIMLIDPSVLRAGDIVNLTLHLKDGSSLLVETEVRDPATR